MPYCQETDCKFVSKIGDNKHELILEIHNVLVNDSGAYYCSYKVGFAPLQNGPILLVECKRACRINVDRASHYSSVHINLKICPNLSPDCSTNTTAVLVFVPPGQLNFNDIIPLVCLSVDFLPTRLLFCGTFLVWSLRDRVIPEHWRRMGLAA